MCVDFRALNKVTTADAYPMPRMDDLLERLGGKSYFTKIDLKAGFWQIGLKQEHRQKTAFITPWVLYEFVVMPFGLRDAPATFQRLMNFTLAQEINEGFTIVYIHCTWMT